jgi:hypothetical protein
MNAITGFGLALSSAMACGAAKRACAACGVSEKTRVALLARRRYAGRAASAHSSALPSGENEKIVPRLRACRDDEVTHKDLAC